MTHAPTVFFAAARRLAQAFVSMLDLAQVPLHGSGWYGRWSPRAGAIRLTGGPAGRSDSFMRAVTYTRYGGPDVLRLADVPAPVPSDQEIGRAHV